MLRRRLLLVGIGLSLATSLVMSACADEDPRFGGAGAIKNVQVFDTPPMPALEGGTPRELFGAVYDALIVPCGGCHRPPGAENAPLFFDTDEASSYVTFKARNYHLEGGKPAASTYGLVERGGHRGRPLNAGEKALISQWRAAERAAGAQPTDAGDGG